MCVCVRNSWGLPCKAFENWVVGHHVTEGLHEASKFQDVKNYTSSEGLISTI